MKILFSVLIGAFTLCGVALGADSGSSDVAALRAAAKRPHVTVDNVRVVGNYAVLDWIAPPSGGMSAYKRASGHNWKLLLSEGGVITASDLIKRGVPAATAHKLQPAAP